MNAVKACPNHEPLLRHNKALLSATSTLCQPLSVLKRTIRVAVANLLLSYMPYGDEFAPAAAPQIGDAKSGTLYDHKNLKIALYMLHRVTEISHQILDSHS